MKRAWGYVVAALSALGAVLAFLLWRKYQKDHVDTLKDALAVSKAEREVKVLAAKREAVEERVAERAGEIAQLDAQLADNARRIVEARTKAKGLTSEQVMAEYKRLGYLR